MERDELLKMIQLYKNKLANSEEQNIIYQILIDKQVKEKVAMTETINTLEENIKALTVEEEVQN